MASKNFVVKHGITVGGVEVIDATGQITSQALVSAVIPGPTKTSDLTNDSGFITSTALNSYALSSAIPTKTSNLTNDSGFITSSALSGYALTSSIPNLTGYALTSAIPTDNNQLTNGAGFITASALSGYALTSAIPSNTNQLTNGAGFITSSALSGYALTSAIPSLTGYATQTYVNTAVSNLVNAAPTTLDTLKEIATALGNDANFSSSITSLIGTKASTASLSTVAFTGSYTDLVSKPVVYSTGSSAPSSPNAGDRWLHADTGVEYTYIIDDNSSQWVETTAASLYNADYNLMSNKPTLATVATSGSYTDLVNKPSFATVATSGSYTDLSNKPTIPSLPSQTGNAGKVLSTNGSTLSWITAASGGGGGSVDLSQVAQDITPNITGMHSIGTDAATWGGVTTNTLKVNAVETIIGTVIDRTVISTATPITYTSLYQTTGTLDGYQWPGLYYCSPYITDSDGAFDQVTQQYVATYATGDIVFAFPSSGPAAGWGDLFTRLIGTPVRVYNQSGGSLDLIILSINTADPGLVNFHFTTVDSITATTMVQAFQFYASGFDTFAPSIDAIYNKSVTTITSSAPVTTFPDTAYASDNGSAFYAVGVSITVNVQYPTFEIIPNIYAQPYPSWYGLAAWIIYFSTNDGNSPLIDRAKFTQMADGDKVYFEYTSTITGNVEHATFQIIGTPANENWGLGYFSFSITAKILDADNPSLLDTNQDNVINYLQSALLPYNQVVRIDSPIEISGLTVSSLFTYDVAQLNYPFFNLNSTIGYYDSPKLRVQSSNYKLGGIDIKYNLKSKKTTIGGLQIPVSLFTNAGSGTSSALISSDSNTSAIQTMTNIGGGIALGANSYVGYRGVSIGVNANSNAGHGTQFSVAIGGDVNAGDYCVAIGNGSSAQYSGAAIGSAARADSSYGLALGTSAISQGMGSTALGISSQTFIPYSLAYGSTSIYNMRNQTIKFQLFSGQNGSPTTTCFLSTGGSTGTTQSSGLGLIVYNFFSQGGNGAGVAYGTATFMIRATGTANPVSAFIWKIVEIKFALYSHKWSYSSALNYQNLGNYEFTIISTTTIATSAAAGHAAWTPSLVFGYSTDSPSSGVYLWAKVTKTDTVGISATAKIQMEVLNIPDPSN
jgi:hypothetical protein